MIPDATDREVLALLYREMDDRSARPPVSPGPKAVEDRIRSLRRRRRARAVVRLVAAALVLTLAGGATWAGMHRWERSAEPAGRLLKQPVRGSLAHDAAFLTGVRRRAVEERTLTIDDRAWRPPVADQVKVLYAGDVDGYRFALVTGPWTMGRADRGPVRTGLWRWLIGRAGAPADRLSQGAVTTSTPEVAVQAIQPGRMWNATAANDRAGVTLAVGVGEFDARLAGPARYAADGTVSLPLDNQAAKRLESGVYAAVLPRDGSYRFAVDGSFDTGWGLLDSPPSDRREYAQPTLTAPVTTEQAAAVVGAWSPRSYIPQTRPAPAAVARVMTDTLLWSGLRLQDASFRLIDAEAIYDPVTPDGVLAGWNMAMAVEAPGGGTFVGVQTLAEDGREEFFGSVDLTGWTIRPAGGFDGLGLAVFSRSDLVLPPGPHESGVDVRILPPAGARTVDLLGPDGAVVVHSRAFEAHRWSGIGLDRAVTKARFLDVHGRTLIEVPIQGGPDGVEARMPMMSWPPTS